MGAIYGSLASAFSNTLTRRSVSLHVSKCLYPMRVSSERTEAMNYSLASHLRRCSLCAAALRSAV
jgi:hypothetical protein